MFETKVQNVESGTLVYLRGVLDEKADLASSLPSGCPTLWINARQISRINSVGVKIWIEAFRALVQAGTRLIFEECAPPIVEQINFVDNFLCGGQAKSVCLPFICESCRNEFVAVAEVSDLVRSLGRFAVPACSACGKQTVIFDDIPEEYLEFLNRKRAT